MSSPDGRRGAREIARTAGALGGILGGFGIGLAAGGVRALARGGSRRDAVDLGLELAGRFGTALGGLTLDVRGAEHLAARPAVFLFNHRSELDVLVMMRLLRRSFTGVAKKELAAVPVVGLVFRLADVAFVDRTDIVAARAALEPAVRRLREGISLAVAPEGTRSPTSELAAFKKGAFHVAMQAGVPIVPVVIHDAADLMPPGAALRAGTVHVTVRAPIPTDGWTVGGLGGHVEEVRRRFLETLTAGPVPTLGPSDPS